MKPYHPSVFIPTAQKPLKLPEKEYSSLSIIARLMLAGSMVAGAALLPACVSVDDDHDHEVVKRQTSSTTYSPSATTSSTVTTTTVE